MDITIHIRRTRAHTQRITTTRTTVIPTQAVIRAMSISRMFHLRMDTRRATRLTTRALLRITQVTTISTHTSTKTKLQFKN